MRQRRLRKHPAQLEISAFINLIVVLVPFLLSTAVFTRISVLDLNLPAKSRDWSGLKADDLKLEVVVRHDAIEVGDQVGGLKSRIPNTAQGPDLQLLSGVLYEVKQKFPTVLAASLLPEPNVPYDTVVHVMDTMRTTKSMNGGAQAVDVELFPTISIGDAPVRPQ
jgi:biopolymer transport protein ExbD